MSDIDIYMHLSSAGLVLIIGVAIWGSNKNKYGGINTYPSMLLCTGGLLAILAGIFGILEIVGVKA